jgi:hypothetical protein
MVLVLDAVTILEVHLLEGSLSDVIGQASRMKIKWISLSGLHLHL